LLRGPSDHYRRDALRFRRIRIEAGLSEPPRRVADCRYVTQALFDQDALFGRELGRTWPRKFRSSRFNDGCTGGTVAVRPSLGLDNASGGSAVRPPEYN
jgi:hypothetical protein